MRLDPKDYNLQSRTQLVQLKDNTIGIIIDRKSRIIMADGIKLLEKIATIQEVTPSTKVCIVTTAPVCSKTRLFFEKAKVTLKEVPDLSTLALS